MGFSCHKGLEVYKTRVAGPQACVGILSKRRKEKVGGWKVI
jgi:hypothetical protein